MQVELMERALARPLGGGEQGKEAPPKATVLRIPRPLLRGACGGGTLAVASR